MMKSTLILLCLFLSLHAFSNEINKNYSPAAAQGIIGFELDLACAEPAVDPAKVTEVRVRATQENVAAGTFPSNFAEYPSYVMTLDAMTGLYKYAYDTKVLSATGSAGNAGIRFYYEYDTLNALAETITVPEFLGNDWNSTAYQCRVAWHGGTIRKLFYKGAEDIKLRTAFGQQKLCGGRNVTFELETNTVSQSMLASQTVLAVSNLYGYPESNNSFPSIIMTDSTDGRFAATVCMPAGYYMQFGFAYATDEGGTFQTVLEQSELSGVLPTKECGVFTWGGRDFFNAGGGENQTHKYTWGSHGNHAESKPVAFIANTTVVADKATTLADGWTYYTSNEEMLIAIEWGTEVPAPPTDVSVKFGASQAEWFANGTGFISNDVGGAALMRRVFDVANTTLSADVGVRYYFTQAEYDAVNTVITDNLGDALTSLDQLSMYKVTSNDDPLDIANITPAEVINLNNNQAASNTSYVGGLDCVVDFAEYTVSSFSGGGGGGASGGAALLPVDFIHFTGQQKEAFIQIDWTTASEVQNDFFDIERSVDGYHFEKIGKVNGSGDSDELEYYEFLDRDPLADINYYRLKQVDFNGKYVYSNVISVEGRSKGFDKIHIFPRLAQDNITIENKFEFSKVSLFNSSGALIGTYKQAAQGKMSLDVSSLPSGTYFVKIDAFIGKFIKQ